jgi:hypothetical protein
MKLSDVRFNQSAEQLLRLLEHAPEKASDPASEARLAHAISELGPAARYVRPEDFKELQSLDSGDRARLLVSLLSAAYGDEIREVLFQSPTMPQLVERLLSDQEYGQAKYMDVVVDFVDGLARDRAVPTRDGHRIEPSTIENLSIRPDGREAPLKIAMAGMQDYILKNEGKWVWGWQNDWNVDHNSLDQLSSQSLFQIREEIAKRPEAKQLGDLLKEIDRILKPRLKEAEKDRSRAISSFHVSGKLDELPSEARVGVRPQEWINKVVGMLKSGTAHDTRGAARGSIHLEGFDQREMFIGDKYVHIGFEHLGLSSKVKEHSIAFKALEGTAHEAGLIQLASGEWKIWTLNTNGFPRRLANSLDVLDAESLDALRARITKMLPERTEDPTIAAARAADPFAGALAQLLVQIDHARGAPEAWG